MRTTDWKFDYSSLPRWNNREKALWVYDEYFEIPQSDMLCCLYAIEEVSMMNYLGFLAILRNKKAPELLLNIADGFSFCVNFSVNTEGNLIFLQPNIRNQTTNEMIRPVLILDMKKNRFSYLKTDNYCPAYKVIQKNAAVFEIEADEYQKNGIKQLAALHGKRIRTRWLKWYSMDRLPQLPQMIF